MHVTGMDSHELQGLDMVQCAALVETNHGIVNLIMNEYACYGKGHTIHCSGERHVLFLGSGSMPLILHDLQMLQGILQVWTLMTIWEVLDHSAKHCPRHRLGNQKNGNVLSWGPLKLMRTSQGV